VSRLDYAEALRLTLESVALVCRTPIAALSARTGPRDIKGWDSFGRLQVGLEIERRLGHPAPLVEIIATRSIGELAELVAGLTP
jgi:acyl carrier protein